MFHRAIISRAAVTGVALSLTAACMNAGTREFHAADIQSQDDPTVQGLRYMGHLIGREAAARSSRFMRWKDLEDRSRWQTETAGVTIVTDFDHKPFEAAMVGIYADMQREPAAAELTKRIRKVE